MYRKFLTVISLVLGTLFLAAGIASADDYVPSAVSSSVLDTTSAPVATSQGVAGASLSYTGTGFNVGGTVGIAIIVLVVGIALCIGGAKMARRRPTHH